MQKLSKWILLFVIFFFATTSGYATPYTFTASVTETMLFHSGAVSGPAPLMVGDTVTGWFDNTIVYDDAIEDGPGRWGGAYMNFFIDFGLFSAETPGGATTVSVADTGNMDSIIFYDSSPDLYNFPSDFTIDEFEWDFIDSSGTALDSLTPASFDPYVFDLIRFGIESTLPGDGWNGFVSFEVESINPATPIPEPATIFLVCLGLICLCSISLKNIGIRLFWKKRINCFQ